MQFDIEQIEGELDDLDRWEKTHGDVRKLSCRRRDSHRTPEELAAAGFPAHFKRCRPVLLSDLRLRLLEYDVFLLKCKEMVSLQRPSSRDYESVRTWFKDNQPIVQREEHFIRRKEDMITLRSGRESAVFDSLVERCLSRVDDFLQRRLRCQIIRNIFLTPELREKTSSGWVRYYAPARVDKLVNIIITIVIFILLVHPVIIMYEVTEMGAQQSALDAIGVLVVFTLIFGMAVSSLTTAKRHELFGASAAYAAVLVVFIGNFGVQQVEILSRSTPG
ncbi:hypothetical protein CLAFUW4_01010 [Fulvia fulva]|uniref:DUF6594 domain-containing protein n=1 Tax=Passalora fulva TaxID=5499 RepID=A0A9Q8P4E9_PASFU|nr:uncharacterized protein CLAFUR5_01016 [Fulvia fulva]KAK4634276.1 hypothetical protein CLAFUR4_01011 [Fulvia fulva]KAK4637077.1 hypothetical protein CLAFUR0_01012 [Fulvia fulva]UJO12662.1 hypothetical protein CLAFUR5_01016 [Fulvia fulva]WPV10217.1 hypothetical protein CLAFUW4_01010 [Fulvia fulva]WPV25215.1 hypothetical protein CLAFUW7_00806 [Fulvia fulva]